MGRHAYFHHHPKRKWMHLLHGLKAGSHGPCGFDGHPMEALGEYQWPEDGEEFLNSEQHSPHAPDMFFWEAIKKHHCDHSLQEGGYPMFGGGERGPAPRGRGFGFGGPRGRGPGRPGRPFEQGDLRWLALDLIAQQPRHGYEVIKAIEDAMGGHYAPSPGAVYPMLTLLEETGLISSETQGAKKLYSLTEAGRAEVETNADAIKAVHTRMEHALHRFGGFLAPELHRAMDNLKASIQVRLSKGELSPESLGKITGALDRAAAEIEKS